MRNKATQLRSCIIKKYNKKHLLLMMKSDTNKHRDLSTFNKKKVVIFFRLNSNHSIIFSICLQFFELLIKKRSIFEFVPTCIAILKIN